jgi:chloramphenicol-sensitive protein RarD
MKENKYLTAVISAYLIWGIFPMFIKLLSGYDAPRILFYRIVFALACVSGYMLLFLRKEIITYKESFFKLCPKEKKSALINIVSGGFLLSINWVLYIYTVNNINIQTASFAYMICPVLTALLAFIVLKEKVKAQHWTALFISIVSCVLLSTVSVEHTLYSVAIALSYALFIISQKKTIQFNRLITLWIQLTISMIFISVVFTTFEIGLQYDAYLLWMTLIMAVAFTIVPLLLSLFGLNGLPSGTIGFLMYINPLMNFFVAFWIYNEKASTNQLLAYLLMLLSVIIYNIGYFKKSANS